MADLGPIQFQAPDEGSSAQDIARENQRLKGLAADTVDVVQERRMGKARDEFADAVESVSVGEEEQAVLPMPVGDPLIDEARNNMIRLRHAMTQGNSSLQARAELELKRRLGVLMARFPGSRDQLQNEFSQFARTDAAFDELGLRDTQRDKTAAVAAKDYQDMTDYAYDSLKMNPGDHPPGSLIFAEEFEYRTNLHQRNEVAGLQQRARSGAASQSAAEKMEDWQTGLVGKRNVVYSAMNDTIEQANEISKALRSDTAEAKQVVQDWSDFGQEKAIRNVEFSILTLQQDFLTEVDPFEFSTDEYQTIKTMTDQTVEHLNRFVEAIKLNSPSAMEKWQSEQIIRQATYRELNPDLDAALLFVETSDSLFQEGVWKTIGGEDAVLSDQIGQRVQSAVSNTIARGWLNGGQGKVTSDMSSTQIRNLLANQLSARDRPYDSASKREQPVTQTIVSHFQHVGSTLAGITEHTPAEGVVPHINSVTGAIDLLNRTSIEPYPEGDDAFFKIMASPGMEKAIRSVQTDGSLHGQGIALGDAAAGYWDKRGQDRHLNNLKELASTSLQGGAPAGIFLELDDSRLAEHGEVRYVVVQDQWDKYDPNPRRTKALEGSLTLERGDAVGTMNKQRQLDRLHTIANDLSLKVTEQVRGLATIYLSRNPQFASSPLDFERAFANNDYQNIVIAPVETEEE